MTLEGRHYREQNKNVFKTLDNILEEMKLSKHLKELEILRELKIERTYVKEHSENR